MPFAQPSLTVRGPALKGAEALAPVLDHVTACNPPHHHRLSALESTVVEGLAEQDRSLQLLANRLEKTASEAEKERERLSAALQAVAEGAQGELSCAEARLLSRLQGVELHWEKVRACEGNAIYYPT